MLTSSAWARTRCDRMARSLPHGKTWRLKARWLYRKDGSALLQVHFGGRWMDTTVGKRPVKGSLPGKWTGWRKR